MNSQDYMQIALKEAQKAFEKDEVPVGAIVVDVQTGEIIAKAGNRSEHGENAFAHAELEVMKKACKKLKQNRLRNMDLYVTLEPCTMCAAAISFMRIRKVYFGAADEKGGAIVNGVKFFEAKTCHHRPEFESGILEEKCSEILKIFFRNKRQKKL
ncbi:MAG: nucleoside deaminase [Alphaproteobacteria bacterium]|nr:nucleoside deaminase [Alphaproteobacteria bacterium]